MRREDSFHLAGDRVHFFPLPNVLWPIHLQLTHSADIPTNAQVDLFSFPVFDKDDSPEASEDGEGRRVWPREEPG